jgi:secondary thiamine-phosphate synthase enzyme
MTVQREVIVSMAGHRDIRDVTAEVRRCVAESGVIMGMAQVFVVGSTAAVGFMEMEPGLSRDLPALLDRLVPPSRDYGHEQAWHDGNGHSHLQATWLGQSVGFPVSAGEPVLGTWQQLFLLECDVKPRRRTLVVTVTGD